MTTQNDSELPMSSPAPSEQNHNCPVSCPNRQSHGRKPVLGAGYIFALIVAVIIGFESLEASYKRVNGEEDFLFNTKSPPPTILIAGLTLIGLSLGIEIDKSILLSGSKELLKSFVSSDKSEGSNQN